MGSIANELITRGWTQTHYQDAEGRVCLRQAAFYAYGQVFDRSRVNLALGLALGDPDCLLPGLSFNDADGRTFDEVLRVAKEADEILDAS